MVGHTCFALRVLRCTTQFVTLLSLLMLSFGQLLLSFAPLHSLRPSFRYHYTTFVSMQCFITWLPTCNHTKPPHSGKHIQFRKTNATILTGFHYRFATSCIHFSRVQSTRCQFSFTRSNLNTGSRISRKINVL